MATWTVGQLAVERASLLVPQWSSSTLFHWLSLGWEWERARWRAETKEDRRCFRLRSAVTSSFHGVARMSLSSYGFVFGSIVYSAGTSPVPRWTFFDPLWRRFRPPTDKHDSRAKLISQTFRGLCVGTTGARRDAAVVDREERKFPPSLRADGVRHRLVIILCPCRNRFPPRLYMAKRPNAEFISCLGDRFANRRFAICYALSLLPVDI